MTDVDATLIKQILYVPQGQRKPNIHHHSKLDDLGRSLEIAERIVSHAGRLGQGDCHLKSAFALTTLADVKN